jgi:BirA family transcriptional regulator, biotin operon repressor / biotin---[acetyl-CoA-carboxylase] ligase
MRSIIHLTDIDSTNDDVSRRAAAGAADGLWVRADQQSKGRGRQGRAWVSNADGNLYCSVLVRPQRDEPPMQQLSFVAALAVFDTLAPYVSQLQLKWPNDVLANGAKLAGILLESGGTQAAPWLVIGIGINVRSHPENIERLATNVHAESGTFFEAATLINALADHFDAWRDHWRSNGFAAVKEAWLSACHPLGTPLVARVEREAISGVFAGLGDDGALLLRLESGEMRLIYAGDVFGI